MPNLAHSSDLDILYQFDGCDTSASQFVMSKCGRQTGQKDKTIRGSKLKANKKPTTQTDKDGQRSRWRKRSRYMERNHM